MIGRFSVAIRRWHGWLHVRRFVDASAWWWLQGIRHPLPERIRKKLFGVSITMLVEAVEDELVFYRPGADGQSSEALCRVNITCEEQPVGDLRVTGGEADRVILRLTEAHYLTSRLVLPAEAARELRAVVANELTRRLPYTAQEIWFECRVCLHGGADSINVDVFVVPSHRIRRLLRILEGSSARPTAVQIDDRSDSAPEIDLLRHAPYAARPRVRWPVRAPLLGGILVLLFGALHLPTIRYTALNTGFQAQVAQAGERAVEAENLARAQAERDARLEFIDARRRDRVSPLFVLRALSEGLPDHTWLSRISVDRAEVRVAGETADATELLRIVEADGNFHDARLTSPVTPADAGYTTRFEIVASLQGAPR